MIRPGGRPAARRTSEISGAQAALDASQEIFETLGDALWSARVLASKSALEGVRGSDPAPLTLQARALCRQGGITAEEKITRALREW